MLLFTIAIFSIFIIFQLTYILISAFGLKARSEVDKTIKEKGISILVPAYNEELVIQNCIDAITHLDYREHETIIINDGSRDGTMALLNDSLTLEQIDMNCAGKLKYNKVKGVYRSRMYPSIIVIDKANGGKADALNAGIDYATRDLVLTIDADSMLEKRSLLFINETFEREDVIAAGGTVHIAQGVKKTKSGIVPTFKNVSGIIRFQIIQYLNGFFIQKFTQSRLKAIIVVAGAFGVFRKQVLFAVGGYRSTVGEDMDITLKIQRYIKSTKQGKKRLEIEFMPEAVCYTECPEDFKDLFTQRFRWQRAFIDCISIYWTGFLNTFGKGVATYFLIDSFLLGTLTAFTNIVAIALMLTNGSRYSYLLAIVMFFTTIVLSSIQNSIAFYKANKSGFKYSFKDYLRIIAFYPLDICFYRIVGLAFVVVGTISYFFTKKKWGSAQRKGQVSIT